MKTSILTLLLFSVSFTCSYAEESLNEQTAINTIERQNPWNIEKIDVGEILNLEDVHFEMDKSDLPVGSQKSIGSLANFMIKNTSLKIELRGHTNSTPPHEYCDQLSTKRAESIRDYLIELGVNPDNVVATGYGKRFPKNSNETSIGRSTNQRVDIKILAK